MVVEVAVVVEVVAVVVVVVEVVVELACRWQRVGKVMSGRTSYARTPVEASVASCNGV